MHASQKTVAQISLLLRKHHVQELLCALLLHQDS